MNRMREAIRLAAVAPAEVIDDTVRQSFSFSESFPGFSGHFPDYPILPAILQLLLGQILAEEMAGRPLQFLSLERAKFTRQLRPGDCIDVSLTCKEKNGQLRCATQLHVADQAAASFSLVFSRGA